MAIPDKLPRVGRYMTLYIPAILDFTYFFKLPITVIVLLLCACTVILPTKYCFQQLRYPHVGFIQIVCSHMINGLILIVDFSLLFSSKCILINRRVAISIQSNRHTDSMYFGHSN